MLNTITIITLLLCTFGILIVMIKGLKGVKEQLKDNTQNLLELRDYLKKQEKQQIKFAITYCLIFLHNNVRGRLARVANETDEKYLIRLRSYVENINEIKSVIEDKASEIPLKFADEFGMY